MGDAFDIVIRGGTLIDGTGDEPRQADVAIADGRIAAVGEVSGRGRDEIDARGRIVTPGFVDIHTHYDGQAIWSERLIPSSQHGVTTVALGNCGVGFAPCRRDDHDTLISVMEGVEDIPELVMTRGLPWDWETFPDYMNALDRRRHDIDVAVYLPHSPLRVYVMGERGANREPATDDDLARMRALTEEAIDAGAIGFATSRLNIHRTGDGRNIPSYDTDRRELLAIGDALRAKGRGIIQAVPDIGRDIFPREIALLREVAEKSGRPVTFSLGQTNDDPDLWRVATSEVEAANKAGVAMTAQIFPRPVGMILGLETSANPFSLCPSYEAIRDLPLEERVRRMRDPEFRARLISETPKDPAIPLFRMARDFERIFALKSAADYEPNPESSVAAQARRTGRSPEDVAYDLLLADDGHALLLCAIANFAHGSLDAVLEMMKHKGTLVALGDGGAHYGMICDASYPTFVLTHWTRNRAGERISLQRAVQALSRDPAQAIGLKDRGIIAPGLKADVNVIDYDRLALNLPHVIADLPGGGRRLMQEASGYVATIVSGKPIVRDGKPSGELPGRLVRPTRN